MICMSMIVWETINNTVKLILTVTSLPINIQKTLKILNLYTQNTNKMSFKNYCKIENKIFLNKQEIQQKCNSMFIHYVVKFYFQAHYYIFYNQFALKSSSLF